jgi:hypothetical protein
MGFWGDVASAVQGGASAAAGLASPGFKDRMLTSSEAGLLRLVFKETLPYDRVWLSNQLGNGGAPYTIPHPRRPGNWLLNVGPDVWGSQATKEKGWELTLVHESTHVWQGHTYGPGYITNSVWSNGCAQAVTGDRNNCYPYTPGQAWGSYNVEQQASLVQDWFDPKFGDCQDADPRFPYIRDVIRGEGPRPSFFGKKWAYQGPKSFHKSS